MEPLAQAFIGLIICFILLFGLKYFTNRYDKDRKSTFGMNLIDFNEALRKNNLAEINRLGVRLVNNPYLEVDQLRIIMLGLEAYKKEFAPKKNSLKKVESAITTRQINWGLFANRYSDPKEYEEALKDIVNIR